VTSGLRKCGLVCVSTVVVVVVVQLPLRNSSGSASALSEGSMRCVRTLRLFLAYYRSLFPGFVAAP